MSLTDPVKWVEPAVLGCDGTAWMTLGFTAAPELSSSPADILLLLDRSSSMRGLRMDFTRQAVRSMIETVARASGDPAGRELRNGSRMGMASFSTTATPDVPLTTQTAALEQALDALVPSGNTNHYEAFRAAQTMQDPASTARQVLVLFTDGITTAGGTPDRLAADLRNQGTEIFCIGLVSQDESLRRWASDPDAVHVATTTDPEQLTRLFAQVAAEVVLAGARDVVLEDVIHPDFQIVQLDPPTAGVAELRGPRTLRWTLDTVGADAPQTVSVRFQIQHIGSEGGVKQVNESILYTDREKQTLTFADPSVQVQCGPDPAQPEPCPDPVLFQAGRCQDAVSVEVPDVQLESLGRIVQISAVIRNVCPGKRVAAAVLLSEVDEAGRVYERGMKTVLLPAHTGDACRDLTLRCVRFVVPETLDVSGHPTGLCNARTFRAQVLANYVDTDFVCCGEGEAGF